MPVENTFDFKKLIVEARTPPVPSEVGQGTAVELPSLFEEPAKAPPVMDSEVKEDKVAIEVAMQQQTKVFTIWRPWGLCRRCLSAIDSGEILLPEDGDHTCPHVQSDAYKTVVDVCLRGDAVLTSKEMFNLPDGTRCVHVEWLKADEASMLKLKRQMEVKKKNSIYPPDVAGAFKK
jgi:hypothetical protein